MPYGWSTHDFTDDDLQLVPVWVCDTVHWPVPMTPLYATSLLPQPSWYWFNAAAQYFSEPRSKGWEHRLRNGYMYISLIPVPKDEIPAREKKFRERMAPVMDDPWGFINKEKAKLTSTIERVWPADLEHMDDFELWRYVYIDKMDLVHASEQYHFMVMRGLSSAFALFRQLCAELFGIRPHDITFAKLMSGYDNSIFQVNKAIAELATRAVALKVDDNLRLPDREVLSAMEQSESGREWLSALRSFIQIHGLRQIGALWDYNSLTWFEDPSLAMPDIKRALAAGGIHAPELHRERLVRKREETEGDILSKTPLEQREWFEKLMRCAQAAQFFSEDHSYHVEYKSACIGRLAFMEVARRLVRAGRMDDPDDIFYLTWEELLAGIKQRPPIRDWLRSHKEEWNYNNSLGPPGATEQVPPFIGDMSALGEIAASDSIFSVVAAPPIATPEEIGATVVGAAGAPGVAEGIARVILSEAEFDKVQPGDILVSPQTNSTWTPLFGIIKGAVTDAGGTMAHAAIVGREYGIPAVVGTIDGTRKIKTGDRIKVDGSLSAVYVLERAK